MRAGTGILRADDGTMFVYQSVSTRRTHLHVATLTPLLHWAVQAVRVAWIGGHPAR